MRRRLREFIGNWAVGVVVLVGLWVVVLGPVDVVRYLGILGIVAVVAGIVIVPSCFSGERIKGTSLTRGEIERLYDKLPKDYGAFSSWATWWQGHGLDDTATANALVRAGWNPRTVVDTVLHDGPGALTGIKSIGEGSVQKILRWLEDYHRKYVGK